MGAFRLLFTLIVISAIAAFAETPPKEWVDPATGHRVVRLSDKSGTASLYFHQNPYTASGDKMVVTTREGLATIDLRTLKI
ncbi:MAG TPA: oligogalacturonate lyase, partial [Terriglobia bacterium]|nr:oligogalacturonate lyase [Terriglobia bacterium]